MEEKGEKMRCKKSNKLIYLYLSDQLSENKRKILENHLTTCPKCALEFALIKKTIEATKSLEEIALPLEVSERIKTRVRQEREKVIKEQKSEISKPHPILKYALVGSSTILILFLGLVVSIIIYSFRGGIVAERPATKEESLYGTFQSENKSNITEKEKAYEKYFLEIYSFKEGKWNNQDAYTFEVGLRNRQTNNLDYRETMIFDIKTWNIFIKK